jgi:porin
MLKLGLQDLNTEFVLSDNGSLFINSSFGIPSLISSNVPVPVFPLTALGIFGRYDLSESISFQAALFDGLPESFENNRYNLNWKLKGDDGALIFAELHYSAAINNLAGKYKAGYYYHSHLKESLPEKGIAETVFEKNYGYYFLADQEIYKSTGKNSLGVFIQLSFCPGNINIHNYYFGGGFTFSGLFNSDDVTGIALAYAHFNLIEIKDETTIEMFYKALVTENLFVQPDVQYIINPAGTETGLPNSLAALIRFGINF